jgi:hypothetical protein
MDSEPSQRKVTPLDAGSVHKDSSIAALVGPAQTGDTKTGSEAAWLTWAIGILELELDRHRAAGFEDAHRTWRAADLRVDLAPVV